jgi:hypothetical protein
LRPPAENGRVSLTGRYLRSIPACSIAWQDRSIASCRWRSRQEYALQLKELDRCLRNYGAGADAARAYLKSYTAAAIASIWPSEPPPGGVHYPDISGMHNLVILEKSPPMLT